MSNTKVLRTGAAVRGGTVTSIAGGRSGVRAGISVSRAEREKSAMRSESSRVGKSRFAKTQ